MHYENTLKDPRAILQSVAAHWGIELTPESLDAALAEGTKEAMAKKIDPEAEPNVLQNRKTPLSELFNGEALDVYQAKAQQLFRHDLGYDLLARP